MLHLIGEENFFEGIHHVDIVDNKELIQYYLNILKLFYATPEAESWIAKKLREDIPIIAEFSQISRTEAILWWCRSQWKLIRKTHREKYSTLEVWEDDIGKVEKYAVWIEPLN